MKNLLLILFAFFSISAFSQDATDEMPDRMFESIILTPNPAHVNKLTANMAAHNAKYHKADTPYEAYVYHISSGPNAGKLIWMMGPLSSWGDLDNRPSTDGHDEDWATNVVPLLNNVEHGEYWKRDNEISKKTTPKQHAMYFIRFHEISKSEGYRFDELMSKIGATMKSMDKVNSWAVYDNQLRQGYKTGRHVISVSGMDKWAEMDDNWAFVPAFEKIHGEGSFPAFSKQMDQVVTNSYDEIWTYDAKMSGKE